MTYHFWYVDRTHFADSETTLAFIITSFVTELLAGNLRHLISILLSFLFPQEPKSAEPHSVTPLGQGQLKLNQRRAQICPQFCSCPSRFRDTAPAHSWPVLSLSGLVPSARQMLICLPSAKLPLFHHRGQLCRLALGFIVPLFPPNPLAWSHDPKLSWPPPCLRSLEEIAYLRDFCPSVWFFYLWSKDLMFYPRWAKGQCLRLQLC